MIIELTKKNDKYYIDIIKPWEDRDCGEIFAGSNGWIMYSSLRPAIYTDNGYFALNGSDVHDDSRMEFGDGFSHKSYDFPCEIDKDTYVDIKLLLTEYKASLEL